MADKLLSQDELDAIAFSMSPEGKAAADACKKLNAMLDGPTAHTHGDVTSVSLELPAGSLNAAASCNCGNPFCSDKTCYGAPKKFLKIKFLDDPWGAPAFEFIKGSPPAPPMHANCKCDAGVHVPKKSVSYQPMKMTPEMEAQIKDAIKNQKFKIVADYTLSEELLKGAPPSSYTEKVEAEVAGKMAKQFAEKMDAAALALMSMGKSATVSAQQAADVLKIAGYDPYKPLKIDMAQPDSDQTAYYIAGLEKQGITVVKPAYVAVTHKFDDPVFDEPPSEEAPVSDNPYAAYADEAKKAAFAKDILDKADTTLIADGIVSKKISAGAIPFSKVIADTITASKIGAGTIKAKAGPGGADVTLQLAAGQFVTFMLQPGSHLNGLGSALHFTDPFYGKSQTGKIVSISEPATVPLATFNYKTVPHADQQYPSALAVATTDFEHQPSEATAQLSVKHPDGSKTSFHIKASKIGALKAGDYIDIWSFGASKQAKVIKVVKGNNIDILVEASDVPASGASKLKRKIAKAMKETVAKKPISEKLNGLMLLYSGAAGQPKDSIVAKLCEGSPKFPKADNILRRIGLVAVPYAHVEDNTDAFQLLCAAVDVMEAEKDIEDQVYILRCVCPSFDVVPDNEVAPEYSAVFKHIGDMKTLTFVKKAASTYAGNP